MSVFVKGGEFEDGGKVPPAARAQQRRLPEETGTMLRKHGQRRRLIEKGLRVGDRRERRRGQDPAEAEDVQAVGQPAAEVEQPRHVGADAHKDEGDPFCVKARDAHGFTVLLHDGYGV
ncbi:MAG: hypothetical protein AAFW98_14040 [Pseudomonadota bacterium]